jgi:hypothetical protein
MAKQHRASVARTQHGIQQRMHAAVAPPAAAARVAALRQRLQRASARLEQRTAVGDRR